MKKIMFSDKYGLTEAVLSENKTQTRRIINCPPNAYGGLMARIKDGEVYEVCALDEDEIPIKPNTDQSWIILPKYRKGEIVAVAQRYNDIYNDKSISRYLKRMIYVSCNDVYGHAGETNKMFVRSEFMPHHIEITKVSVQRFQDISDEDCIAEGIRVQNVKSDCARDAYALLIDKISGKGTWESNPWVWKYEFKLID